MKTQRQHDSTHVHGLDSGSNQSADATPSPDAAPETEMPMTMNADSSGHAMPHGHGDHAAMFRRKFWTSLLLSIPAVAYSTMVQHWLHYTAPAVPGHRFVAPIFGTLVFVWGGPFASMPSARAMWCWYARADGSRPTARSSMALRTSTSR